MRRATRAQCAQWKMKSRLRRRGAHGTETPVASTDEGSERDTKALLVTLHTKEVIACFMTSLARNEGNHGGLLLSLALASRHFNHENVNQHDLEVEEGVAAGLAKTLHNSLLLHQMNGNTYRCHLNDAQGLHIAILSSSLSMVLMCSQEILSAHVSAFQADLLIALGKMTELFVQWAGDATIQHIVLHSTIKTISFLVPHVPCVTEQLVDFLALILDGAVSDDVRLYAADTLVQVFEDPKVKVSQEILKKVEGHASRLITTLSTAGLTGPGMKFGRATMDGLYKVAEASNVVLAKMTRRRGTLLVVAKDLSHRDEGIRELALGFCKAILTHRESIASISSGLEGNATRLVESIINSAQTEPDPRLRLIAISLLREIVKVDFLSWAAAMNCLRLISKSGESDDEIIEAATGYCVGMSHGPGCIEKLSTVVTFTIFPYPEVRSEALSTLEGLIGNQASACLLLEDTDMLEYFAIILEHGTDADCTIALNITRRLASSSSYHEALCGHSNFLGAVVHMVARDQVSNRSAHLYGVELILALLSNEDNAAGFIQFHQLLPWLVTFVNSTKAHEDFKQEVISVIIRLSKASLDGRD